MSYILLAIAAMGHAIFWTAIVNRLHGLGLRRRLIDLATAACGFMLAVVPIAIAAMVWQNKTADIAAVGGLSGSFVRCYVYSALLFCGGAILYKLWLTFHAERAGVLLENHTTRVDVRDHGEAEHFAPGIPALLGRLPGNQALDLHVHEKQLIMPRLSAVAEGLRIAHITDLHMSGRIAKSYFAAVVDQVNSLQPDLVAITGDIVERPPCLAWLPDTLGRLRAPAGVFYVLGNHDRRVDQGLLKAALAKLGLIHLGGCWRQLAARDAPVVLAGNELPWFGPAPRSGDCPAPESAEQPLRILLAHGPDQFAWALDHDFDLMLAGHNHGGQVRLPGFGALLTPSRSGTRYAGGIFRRGNTVMHVSRGTSSLTPFRWNCPPEIALLILRAKKS